MLKALPLIFVFLIYKIFFQRYLGHQVEHVVSWRSIILSFINKEAKPTKMSHFRGVCLLDVLSKMFMSVLVMVLKRQAAPLHWKSACTFAYEAGLSTADLILTIKTLLARAYDWRDTIEHFFVLVLVTSKQPLTMPLSSH